MEPWNPWRALRSRSIDLWFVALEGDRGRWSAGPHRDEILVEETLGRRHRREVLAHELVHAERRIGWPDASAATMELEEERVWRIALLRLAPPEAVRDFVNRRLTVGPVTLTDIADEFDLSQEATERLIGLLVLRLDLPPTEAA